MNDTKKNIDTVCRLFCVMCVFGLNIIVKVTNKNEDQRNTLESLCLLLIWSKLHAVLMYYLHIIIGINNK